MQEKKEKSVEMKSINYSMVLEYIGTAYAGWQRQTSKTNTIQGKLEAVLSKMTDSEVTVNGSGRTDAGVHAKAQVISTQFTSDLSCNKIKEYMNTYLPQDIRILSVKEADPRFHARLKTKGKEYLYRVSTGEFPSVFEKNYVYTFTEPLDIKAMEKAAKYLIGTHDFAAFTATKKSNKSTERTIEEIRIVKEKEEIHFYFKGDGFLYHMVRILMGTLLEIGTGSYKPEKIVEILHSKSREQAGPLVPAKGLTLLRVLY